MTRIEIDEAILRQLFSEGVPLVEIAERFGCTRHPISDAVRRLGLSRSPDHYRDVPHVRELDEEVLRQLFDDGCSLEAIAQRFGCSHTPVRRVIAQLGLARNRLPSRTRRDTHPNWHGGRIIDAAGYVRVKVERGHTEADCKGYAREHRLVMTAVLGRPLVGNEVVHHLNHNRQDNRPENLMVMTSEEHCVLHCRTMQAEAREKRAATALANFAEYHRRGSAKIRRMVPCRCGCGTLIETPNRWGAERKFVFGHGRRNSSSRTCQCGT